MTPNFVEAKFKIGLALALLCACLSTTLGLAQPNSGKLPNWWNGQDEWADVPPFPEPFRQASTRPKNSKQPLSDLTNPALMVLPLQHFQRTEGALTRQPISLQIPAGTRWTRTSEGYGSSSSPSGRFLKMGFRLTPCPANFPRQAGAILQNPREPADAALYFLIPESGRAKCEIDVQIYSPRVRDLFSQSIAQNLTPTPRVQAAHAPFTPAGRPLAAESDRLDPGSRPDRSATTPPPASAPQIGPSTGDDAR
jgi:hypothetical protein